MSVPGAEANVKFTAPLEPLTTSAITVSPVSTSISWIINWVESVPKPWFLWGAFAPEFNKFIVVAEALPIVVENCLFVIWPSIPWDKSADVKPVTWP